MKRLQNLSLFLIIVVLQGCCLSSRDSPNPPPTGNSLHHYYTVYFPDRLREFYGDSWKEVYQEIDHFWRRIQDVVLRGDAEAFADLVEYPLDLHLRDPYGVAKDCPYRSCVISCKKDMKRFFPLIFIPSIRKNFSQKYDNNRYDVHDAEWLRLHWNDSIVGVKVKNLHSGQGNLYNSKSRQLFISALNLTNLLPERTVNETLRAGPYPPSEPDS